MLIKGPRRVRDSNPNFHNCTTELSHYANIIDMINFLLSPGQAECLDCPQSYYCGLEGAVEPTICPPGSYCPPRSVLPTPCPKGTYAPGEGLSKEAQCTPCPAGKSAPLN